MQLVESQFTESAVLRSVAYALAVPAKVHTERVVTDEGRDELLAVVGEIRPEPWATAAAFDTADLPVAGFDVKADAPVAEILSDELGGHPRLLSPLEREALVLNLDAALRVHSSHHFFCWTQGMLQNLMRHELLICAIRKEESMAFCVDSFSTNPSDPSLISGLFSRDTVLVPHLLKAWEENHYEPVTCEIGKGTPTAGSALAQELERAGATSLVAHGAYDTFGKPVSFFIFACKRAVTGRQSHLVNLVVPALHGAWVRTQIKQSSSNEAVRTREGSGDILTAREQEVLHWVYLGKSNIEIGIILGISSLTVKNHVQKILRRLDVQNRAQAVGKALALRIIDGSGPR